MKTIISSLDLTCIVRELAELRDAKVEKVYQINDEFIFKLYKEGKPTKTESFRGAGTKSHAHYILRVINGKLIHLTQYLKENPEVPSHFCMYLRKYLHGGRIVSITQPGMERIVEVRIRAGASIYRLIFELFSKGNVIVTDDSHKIRQVLKVKSYGSRELRPNRPYNYPPSKFDLSHLSVLSFKRAIKGSRKDKLVTALAVNVALGGSYAEEVCLNSKIDKDKDPKMLSDDEINKCYEHLVSLVKKVKYLELNPRVILKEGIPIDVAPFKLKIYEDADCKEFPNFNMALDYYYVASEKASFEMRKQETIASERARIKHQVMGQETHLKDMKREAEALRVKAESLKSNLYLVQSVQESLLNAKRGGYSWIDIRGMLKREKDSGSPEALLVKDLSPDTMSMILDINDGLEVGLSEDVAELMNSLFERAKKLESKFEGTLNAIGDSKKKLDDLSVSDVSFERNVPKKVFHKASEWYAHFKWFYSSEGFLVITGRDARQNEELINKYLEPKDLVLHADVHGSPFTIIRDGKSSGEPTRLEAAQFTALHSRAWELKSSIDVYYVKPHQVSKQVPSGEYISTGAFMVTGKKSYVRNVLSELCVGVEELGDFNYRLITGPKPAVVKKSRHYLILHPGDDSKSEVIKKVREHFKNYGYSIPTEELQKALPSKGFKVYSIV